MVSLADIESLEAVAARSCDAFVAPWIAARLIAWCGGDHGRIVAALRGLTEGQLAGVTVIREADVVHALAGSRAGGRLAELSTYESDALRIAAHAVEDRVDLLRVAADVDSELLLSPALKGELAIAHGRYRFRDPAMRILLRRDLGEGERLRIHAALADASDRYGRTDGRAWHGYLSAPDGGEHADALAYAARLLDAGNAEAALEVARTVLGRAPLSLHPSLRLLLARASLAAGYFADAKLHVALIATDAAHPMTGAAERIDRAADSFLRGPEPMADPLQRLVSQSEAFVTAAVTLSDRGVMPLLIRAARLWESGQAEADRLQANAWLDAIPTPRPWPWSTVTGPLTPIAETALRGQQTWFQLYGDEPDGAAETMTETLLRLPLTQAGGGMNLRAVELLAPRLRGLGPRTLDALRALASARTIEYGVSGAAFARLAPEAARRSADVDPADGSDLDLRGRGVGLTARQRDVLRALAEGLSNKEIGGRLGMSYRTVEIHLTQIYRRTGSANRTALLAQLRG